MIVDGNMKMNGCLCTQAWLQNMVLEDSRPQIEGKLFIYWFLGRYDSLVLASMVLDHTSALEMTKLSNVLITEKLLKIDDSGRFFASFPWKQVKVYWLAMMGPNFDDYPVFHPKNHPLQTFLSWV